MDQVDHDHLLAGVAATSGDCLLYLAFDGTVLWASAAVADVVQRDPEELVGDDVSVLAADDDAQMWTRNLQRIHGGEAVDPHVIAMTRRDGSRVDALVRLGSVCDATRRAVGVIAIIRDITDERRIQRELDHALQLSRAGFEQVRTPQAVLDLSGRMTSVNRAWCELFGHSEDFFIGRDIMTLVHPLDLVNAVGQQARLRRGDVDSVGSETIFRNARGSNLSLVLDLSLLREPGGAPQAVFVCARDLTHVEEAQHRLATQESLYRALGRQSWDAAVVTDAQLNITYISPAVVKMLGYEAEEALMLDGWDLVHPEDRTWMHPLVESVLSEAQRTERFVVRVQHKSGGWRWVEESLTNCLTDPHIGGLVANLRDITEQVETQEALRLSDERNRAILETAQEGIVASAPDGSTLFVNDKMGQILGLSLHDLYLRDARLLLRRDPRSEVLDTLGEDGSASYEMTYSHPDGSARILSVSTSRLATDASGTHLGWLSMVADVTEARHTERRLRHQALHDPLTGLPNRYLLLDRLHMADARQQRSDSAGTAVLFLDLDGFKGVNDAGGHEAGDHLLTEVGSRLTSAVRAADTVGRMGGDEFAIICEDISEAAVMMVASRIQEAFGEPFILTYGPAEVSVSVGVAMSPPTSFPDLFRQADLAMYEAKKLGGGRTAVAGASEPPPAAGPV